MRDVDLMPAWMKRIIKPMLQQTEATHPGINQVTIEKDWWATVTLKALFLTDCREWLIFKAYGQ